MSRPGASRSAPFDDRAVDDARRVFTSVLGDHSAPALGKMDFGLIHSILRFAEDLDAEIFACFEAGVNLGVTEPLPRTPLIYRK